MPKKKISKSPDETDEITEEDLTVADNEQTEESSEVEPEVGEGKADEGAAQETEKIKVGEEELSSDEVQRLISKAREVESIEKEQNVDIAHLYPDYTKKSQLLSDPVKLGAYIAEKYGSTKLPTQEDEARQKAVKEAREVYGIVTKEDLDSFKESFMQELEVKNLQREVKEAGKEFGVEPNDVLDLMKYAKIDDPDEAARKIANYKKIAATEGLPEKPKPTFTEKTGSSGTHVPQGKKMPSIDDTEGISSVIKDMMQSPDLEEL